MRDIRWTQRLEDNWRIRIGHADIIGRIDAGVFGPHRWNDPVEVELTDAQIGPFRQMIADLEGDNHVSVSRVQGRFASMPASSA